MTDHLDDVRQYATSVDENALAAIVRFCGSSLHRAGSPDVSTADPRDMGTVFEHFAGRRLGLTTEAARDGIRAASDRMQAARRKSRVTFYYLVAESTGTLGRLG